MKLSLRLGFVFIVITTSCMMWLSLLKKEEKPVQVEKETMNETLPQIPETIIEVQVERASGSLNLALETYLQGVIGSEMPASFELEALKAQAVAARTFVCKREYKVDDTTSSQVYHDEEQLKQIWSENYARNAEKIKQAIDETKGEIITYQGLCITAAFFSSSNGATNNSEDYWQEEVPYLRSVRSPQDVQVENNSQSITLSREEFSTTLGFQNTVSAIGDTTYYENGYVETISIDGIVFRGREMREKLKLRSNAFELVQDGDTIVITTHGYGHGIGLSQYGAQAMAQEGKNYQEILKHYYTDVEISKVGV